MPGPRSSPRNRSSPLKNRAPKANEWPPPKASLPLWGMVVRSRKPAHRRAPRRNAAWSVTREAETRERFECPPRTLRVARDPDSSILLWGNVVRLRRRRDASSPWEKTPPADRFRPCRTCTRAMQGEPLQDCVSPLRLWARLPSRSESPGVCRLRLGGRRWVRSAPDLGQFRRRTLATFQRIPRQRGRLRNRCDPCRLECGHSLSNCWACEGCYER